MRRITQLQRRAQGLKRRRGATVVLFAAILVVMIAFLALSVDLGYVCAVKGDLQAAADAGALAGTGMIFEEKKERDVVAIAQRFAEMNFNNQGVMVGTKNQIDVQVGHWDAESRRFIPQSTPRDAVQVIASSKDSPLFFGRAVGRQLFSSEAKAVATYRPRDIMLVLDVSGSMSQARGGVRKIDELKSAISAFLAYIGTAKGRDRVGFSYYSTTATLGMGLTYDLKAVEKGIKNKLFADGWTNISDGMLLAREELNRNRREQANPLMVVLTDGAANTIQPENTQNIPEAKRRVLEQAYLAVNEGIPVFTMALDSLNTAVDVALMAQVAQITGSETFHVIAGDFDASGNRQLKEAFRRVARNQPVRLVD